MTENLGKIFIERNTLEGLKNAYIALETQRIYSPPLFNGLCSWIECVLEDAGMIEDVRIAIQEDWNRRRSERVNKYAKQRSEEIQSNSALMIDKEDDS